MNANLININANPSDNKPQFNTQKKKNDRCVQSISELKGYE